MPNELEVWLSLRQAGILRDIPTTNLPRSVFPCCDPRYDGHTRDRLAELITVNGNDPLGMHHNVKATYLIGGFGGASGISIRHEGNTIIRDYVALQISRMMHLKGGRGEAWLLIHPDCGWRQAMGISMTETLERLAAGIGDLRKLIPASIAIQCGVHICWTSEDQRERTYMFDPSEALANLASIASVAA